MILLFALAQSHLAAPPPVDDDPPPKFDNPEIQRMWNEYGQKIQGVERGRQDLLKLRDEGSIDKDKYAEQERRLIEAINHIRRERRAFLDKGLPPGKGFDDQNPPPRKELPPGRGPPYQGGDPNPAPPPEKPAPGQEIPQRKYFNHEKLPPGKERPPEGLPPGRDIPQHRVPPKNGVDPRNFPPKEEPPPEKRAPGEGRPPRKEVDPRNFGAPGERLPQKNAPGKDVRAGGGEPFEENLRRVLQRIEQLRQQSDEENPGRKEEMGRLENEIIRMKEMRKKMGPAGGDRQQRNLREDDPRKKQDFAGQGKKPVTEESSGIWGFLLIAAVLVAAGFGLIALLRKTVFKKWRQKRSDRTPLALER
jgi:hypothetical protein